MTPRRNIGVFLVLILIAVCAWMFSPEVPHSGEVVATAVLSDESKSYYQKQKDLLQKMVVEEGAQTAITYIREEMARNKQFATLCHDLSHDTGHSAYALYQDFAEAARFQSEVCNSGYLHGVIESHFQSSQDLAQTMYDVCADYPFKKFMHWECLHGVGHGLMFYSSNDLTASLAMCDRFETVYEQSSCVNGVFMENFASEEEYHRTEFLDSENLFYPCDTVEGRHKPDCYLYAPTHYLREYPQDYSGALAWCKNAETDYVTVCVHGVGSQAMKENILDAGMIEELCLQGDDQTQAHCVAGMVSNYINHHGDIEAGRELCTQLWQENAAVCEVVVASKESKF